MKKIIIIILGLVTSGNIQAQRADVNYDESKVPEYKLPDPLINNDGSHVKDPKQWTSSRRGEILNLFEEHMYGKVPEQFNGVMEYEVLDETEYVFGGMAQRKQVRVFFDKDKRIFMDILIYLPQTRSKPVPVFLGYNFDGNHTITHDEEVFITKNWVDNDRDLGITDNKADERNRGMSHDSWAIEVILSRGYGIASIYKGDVDPDFHDEFQNGIHPLFYRKGQNKPDPDEWGTIGAWAWGLSCALDYFETDDEINHDRVIVMGHSRLGKTSLWAGAQDERFAIVISNDSGCGGAALSRRRFGETVEAINDVFPHWFNDNFLKYNGKEDALPIDQHMLIALMAPRPVYIASAEEDEWADPKGEFMAGLHADPVYNLFGLEGLPVNEWPEVGKPVHGTIGYHVRLGKHDVTLFDWIQYLDFADKHLK
ncbi:acetylxylan esterase [Bacteroidota bacterium]